MIRESLLPDDAAADTGFSENDHAPRNHAPRKRQGTPRAAWSDEAFCAVAVARFKTSRSVVDRGLNVCASNVVNVRRKGKLRNMDVVVLEPDGRGSFTFTFSSPRGEISGRVNVGTEGPPDRRSTPDQEQAAKNQILARELALVCE